MVQSDLFKRSLEAGTSFLDLTRERAEAVVKEWVEAGDMGRGRAKKAVDDLLERSHRVTEELQSLIRREIGEQLSALGIATRDDLARLEARIETMTAAGAPETAAAAGRRTTTRAPGTTSAPAGAATVASVTTSTGAAKGAAKTASKGAAKTASKGAAKTASTGAAKTASTGPAKTASKAASGAQGGTRAAPARRRPHGAPPAGAGDGGGPAPGTAP
ncbi:MAG: phasin family protein [Acidimicrobiales bacterium]